MPRGRWFVFGFLIVAALVGGVLNSRDPFDAHPSLAYPPFLADVQAGRVAHIARWRDQLEVTEGDRLLSVTVPPGTDVHADLARAIQTGGIGISYQQIPDDWLSQMTPWVPMLILLAGSLIWVSGIMRSRRFVSRPVVAEVR